jgi:hypothetical protein
MLHACGLLAYLLPQADRAIAEGGSALAGSLARLDEYRRAGLASAEDLTNALLMGSLLQPLGVPLRRVAVAPPARREGAAEGADEAAEPEPERDDVAAELAALGVDEEEEDEPEPADARTIPLPFARRDLERLRLVLTAQRRLREAHAPASARRALAARAYFDEAVRWLEIHGGEGGRELAARWRGLGPGPVEGEEAAAAEAGAPPPPREPGAAPRRRRRRRRRRPPTERPGNA